jgi:hypothetical protein
MEARRSQPVATGGRWEDAENGSASANRLPWVATGCLSRSMVRRGSTVRVRQRALQKSRKAGPSVHVGLQSHQRASGMELFMELPGLRRLFVEPPDWADPLSGLTERVRARAGHHRPRSASPSPAALVEVPSRRTARSYAAVGGPNQVVSASASPSWVRSPTQATYPSGRINTAVGAVTAPSTGSSHIPT